MIVNCFNVKTGRYFNYQELIKFCEEYKFKTVPILNKIGNFELRLQDLLGLSNRQSTLGNTIQEGIVLRNLDMDRQKISFKVINPEFLLKYNL